MRPAVHFSQYQRVFLPKEPLRLAYRGTLVDKVHVALYRTTLPRVMALRAADTPRNAKPLQGESLISEWDQAIPDDVGGEDDWFYRHLALDRQPEGLYRVFLQGTGTFNGKPFTTDRQAVWFNVSHVGVVTKRTPDQSLVYAVDLTTGQPLPGVRIAQTSAASDRPLGTTDRNGLLQTAGIIGGGALVGSHGGAVGVVNVRDIETGQRLNGYVYTDRPIYRPGQDVHVKAVLRDKAATGYRIRAGAPATLTITDAAGEDVLKRTLTVSQTGAVDDAFTLGTQPNRPSRSRPTASPSSRSRSSPTRSNSSPVRR
jgi:hypothetical protein